MAEPRVGMPCCHEDLTGSEENLSNNDNRHRKGDSKAVSYIQVVLAIDRRLEEGEARDSINYDSP